MRLMAQMTREERLVAQAQRLRYRVFAGERGARLESGYGIDADRFDAHCEHLVVRDAEADEVVGTYRVLPPERALRAGGFYAERGFDLGELEPLRHRIVEVGRACVHPGYRAGSVMPHMWSALARYLIENRHDYAMGCASVGMDDGGHRAASIFREAFEQAMSPVDCRIRPLARLPLESLCDTLAVEPPPLLRGYLNLGAWICGEPAWDRDFGCADLPILLPLARMNSRYTRHFLAQAA